MSSRMNWVALGLTALSLFVAVGGTAARQKQSKPSQQNSAGKMDEAAEGAKRFEINCGRCHQPPQDISRREAKAVLRHMRQRAMLSAEDERLIMKFIAP